MLLVNEVEAKALTGIGRPASAAKKLAERCCSRSSRRGRRARSPRRRAATGSAVVSGRAVDTTGAGDTFDAAFIDGWLQGHRVDEVLAFACACGALSTEKPGGYDGQPTRAEALRLVGGPA
jgi:sugar/nucleoside kinase (ribokinase family)